jgi:prevent-host-death family protein
MEASSAASGSDELPDGEVRVNVHYAKTHLSKLLERAEAGEDIVVCRNGVPVVRLETWRPRRRITGLGMWKGLFEEVGEFTGQTTDEEVLKAIYGDDFDMDAERAFFEEDSDA